MIIASVLNISLDIPFWQASDGGVAGAAIATVIAQSFSAVYCFLILRRIDIVHLSRADFMTAAGMNARLMKLGIPVVFQNIIIGESGHAEAIDRSMAMAFCKGDFMIHKQVYGLLKWQRFLWICHRYFSSQVGQNLADAWRCCTS